MAITKRSDKGSALTYTEMDDNFDAIAPRSSESGSVQIPAGTTGERDVTPAVGMFRYNEDTNAFEGYQNGAWQGIGGVGSGDVNQNAWTTIAVAGQTNVVADAATDTVEIIAGTNVTITTDALNDTITINSAGGGGDFDGAYSSLSGIPSSFPPSAHNQAWGTITATPTTLAGYGITDGATGVQGITGVQGVEGSQGDIGPDGAQGTNGIGIGGNQGVQGIQGEVTGVVGPQGTQGIIGSGTQGTTGATGFGAEGSQGAQGANGFQGAGGNEGDPGDLGNQGVQGSAGSVQGLQGTQGLLGQEGPEGFGIQGFQGTTGIQGDLGFQGTDGPAGFGLQGHQGIQGDLGPAGAGSQGIQGLQGGLGIQGDLGPEGPEGAGAQGIQGLQGTTGFGIQGADGVGDTGAQGIQGIQGAQGAEGNTGIQGLQGESFQGVQGIQGLIGFGVQGVQGISTQGISGADGVGDQGNEGVQGMQGTQGIIGITGLQGVQGMQGTQSVQGLQGPDNGVTTNSFTAVNVAASGIGSLAYSDITGEFTYTPAAPVTMYSNSSIITIGSTLGIDIDGTPVTSVESGTTISDVLTIDASIGNVATVTASANYSIAIDNMPSETARVQKYTVYSYSNYVPTGVSIPGSSPTLKWNGGTTPSPVINRVNVFEFTILQSSGILSGTVQVLGEYVGSYA